MNKTIIATLILSAGCAVARAQTAEDPTEGPDKIRYQLILPEEKTPEVIKPNEPNPFNKADGGAKSDDSTSEENRLKDILHRLEVTGIKMDPETRAVSSVMLGGIRLERGMVVPRLFPDQSVFLRVNSLSEDAIELFWVPKKKRSSLVEQRTPVIIPINLKPTIRATLPTVAESSKGGSAPADHFIILTPGSPAEGSNGTDHQSPPRAVVVDETGTTTPPTASDKAVTPDQKDAKGEHPFNLLQNLFNSSKAAQQPVTPDK